MQQTIRQNQRLFFLTNYIVKYLEKQGVKVVVLKGIATASFYPVPELRKSGDVDLFLLDKSQLPKVREAFLKLSFRAKGKKHGLHHEVWQSGEGIEIEIHTGFSDGFEDGKLDKFLKKMYPTLGECIESIDMFGVKIPSFDKEHHAFYLLVHMYGDYMRTGFSIKLIFDMMFLFEKMSNEEIANYMQLVQCANLTSFANLIASCTRYIGMSNRIYELMKGDIEIDISKIESVIDESIIYENYNSVDDCRLIVPSKTGVFGLVKTFHLQMKINFPRLSKIPVCWIYTYPFTLARFIKNNITLRRIPTFDIIKNSYKSAKERK